MIAGGGGGLGSGQFKDDGLQHGRGPISGERFLPFSHEIVEGTGNRRGIELKRDNMDLSFFFSQADPEQAGMVSGSTIRIIKVPRGRRWFTVAWEDSVVSRGSKVIVTEVSAEVAAVVRPVVAAVVTSVKNKKMILIITLLYACIKEGSSATLSSISILFKKFIF